MPQPTEADLRIAIGLPPERAVEYFRSKGYAITDNWHDLWQEAHARAFTVAGVTRLDVLEDIRNEIQAAIDGDITLRDFIDNLEPRLRADGWWGKQVQVDEATGEARLVQTGSPWRLRTIYRTNLQTSYMAGRWAQMIQNVRFRPYWEYVAVMDRRTRPAHAAMNGLVFRYDDPFWEHFYPPNGFNCRCTVRALSESNLKTRNLAVSASGKNLRETWQTDTASGLTERIAVYKGPGMRRSASTDLGWNYNPGRAAWQPDLDAYDPQLGRAYVAAAVDGAAFDRFVAGNTEGTFPVAIVDRELFGTQTQQLLVSSETLAELRAADPALGVDDFRRLQQILDRGEMAARGNERIVTLDIDGVRYRIELTVDSGGRQLELKWLSRSRS